MFLRREKCVTLVKVLIGKNFYYQSVCLRKVRPKTLQGRSSSYEKLISLHHYAFHLMFHRLWQTMQKIL